MIGSERGSPAPPSQFNPRPSAPFPLLFPCLPQRQLIHSFTDVEFLFPKLIQKRANHFNLPHSLRQKEQTDCANIPKTQQICC